MKGGWMKAKIGENTAMKGMGVVQRSELLGRVSRPVSRSWAIYGAGYGAASATAATLALLFAALALAGFLGPEAAGVWGLAGWGISLLCGALVANMVARRWRGYAGERLAFSLWALFTVISIIQTGTFRWVEILLRLGLAWLASGLAGNIWQRMAARRVGLAESMNRRERSWSLLRTPEQF